MINLKCTQLAIAVQQYADENCAGDFNVAVRELLRVGFINQIV